MEPESASMQLLPAAPNSILWSLRVQGCAAFHRMALQTVEDSSLPFSGGLIFFSMKLHTHPPLPIREAPDALNMCPDIPKRSSGISFQPSHTEGFGQRGSGGEEPSWFSFSTLSSALEGLEGLFS